MRRENAGAVRAEAGERRPAPEPRPAAIAVEGRNCWRRVQARRAAFLVDGVAYFSAFTAAAERAERSILILAWDFNGAISVPVGAPRASGGRTKRLDAFLEDLLRRRPELEVRILDWDYPLLYQLDRQVLPSYRFRWFTHPRFHFQLDAEHPFGASHHQKVVVIDDALAFVGGLDFAAGRWDTPEHRSCEPGRSDASGRPCGPYHDLMMAVDGEAAAALAELARDRWRRATGTAPPPVRAGSDPWPVALRPDLRDVRVAISRTDPVIEERTVREVEALYLDAIRAARRFLYIENQYLTSARIGDAICARLREPDGPEVVIVTTQTCAGWLEEGTMGVLRCRLVERLLAADRWRRLRLYTPQAPDLGDNRFIVHSKAMVVDDVLARVGSANLNNRSMGLDTECDLTVEWEGKPAFAAAISGFRNRLLAEHLATTPEAVQAAVERSGSLIAAIEGLCRPPRTLAPLDHVVSEWLDGVMPEAALVDPDAPLDPGAIFESIGVAIVDGAPSTAWRWGWLALGCVAVLLFWILVPSAEGLEAQRLAGIAGQLHGPLGAAVALAGFVVATVAFVPLPGLVVATVLAFGPGLGIAHSLTGALLGALAGWAIGRWLGRDTVRRLAGKRLDGVNRALARHGVAAVVAVRLFPVAPFTVVNLVAGMTGVRCRDFALGTLIGVTPGVLLLALFAEGVADAIQTPTRANVAFALSIVLVLAGLGWAMRGFLRGSPRRGWPKDGGTYRGSTSEAHTGR